MTTRTPRLTNVTFRVGNLYGTCATCGRTQKVSISNGHIQRHGARRESSKFKNCPGGVVEGSVMLCIAVTGDNEPTLEHASDHEDHFALLHEGTVKDRQRVSRADTVTTKQLFEVGGLFIIRESARWQGRPVPYHGRTVIFVGFVDSSYRVAEVGVIGTMNQRTRVLTRDLIPAKKRRK